jgi:hypothetical protein
MRTVSEVASVCKKIRCIIWKSRQDAFNTSRLCSVRQWLLQCKVSCDAKFINADDISLVTDEPEAKYAVKVNCKHFSVITGLNQQR